jgi:hypothetical protein
MHILRFVASLYIKRVTTSLRQHTGAETSLAAGDTSTAKLVTFVNRRLPSGIVQISAKTSVKQ